MTTIGIKRAAASAVAAAALAAIPVSAASAEWKPAGPITLNIAFKAGGGTDTQARLIGEALAKKKGWKFIYKNITGKGGANLARAMKGAKADGLTLGMAVTETFTYVPLISKKAGYTAGDFDYIITTAPTQMGVVVRADSGWKTMEDVARAAKAGKKIRFAIMSQRLGDAAYVIGQKYGIKFNNVKARGGRGVLNALMAKDVDIGFIAGIHHKAVKAGQLRNLLSAENERLRMSPNVPTLKEAGIAYEFGVKFLVFAPKGMPADAKKALADAFAEVLSDSNSKASKFVNRAFGVPPLDTGAKLDKVIADGIALNKKLLATIN